MTESPHFPTVESEERVVIRTSDPGTLRPSVGSWAEELYAAMEPLTYADSSYGWPLLTYHESVGMMFQFVRDLVRDTPLYPGWSSIVDPDRVPAVGIPWLGQIVGVPVKLPGKVMDRVNLHENPSAEIDVIGATTGGTETVALLDGGFVGSNCYGVYGHDSTDMYWAFARRNGQRYHVLEGKSYTWSAYVIHTAGAARHVKVGLDWYKANGDYISNDLSTEGTVGGWARYSVTGTAPTGAAFVIPTVLLYGGGAADGDIYGIDGLLLEQSAAVGSYFDGSYRDSRWLGPIHRSRSAHLVDESLEAWTARYRNLIKEASGWKRGTPAALAAAAKLSLSGSRSVRVLEREGSAYRIKVQTLGAETPDPATTLADILSQKAAALALTYELITVQTYDHLRDTHTDYAEVKTDYGSYFEALHDVSI